MELIIPEGTREIAAYAYQYRKDITKVWMPDSVVAIGDCAFRGCENLDIVYISTKLEYLGHDAFFCCDTVRFCFDVDCPVCDELMELIAEREQMRQEKVLSSLHIPNS